MASSWAAIRGRIHGLSGVVDGFKPQLENVSLRVPNLLEQLDNQRSELMAKHKQIGALQDKMDKLGEEFQEEQQRKSKLEKDLRELLQSRGCAVDSDARETQFELREAQLKFQLEQMSNERDELSERVQVLEAELRATTPSTGNTAAEQLRKVTADYEEAQAVLDEKDRELLDARKANADLRDDLKRWKKNAPDMILEMNEQIERLKEENQGLVTANEALTRETTRLNGIVQDAILVVQQFQEAEGTRGTSTDELQAKLDAMAVDLDNAKADASAKDASVHQLESEVARLKAVVASKEKELATATSTADGLRLEVQKQTTRSQELDGKLTRVQGELAVATNKIGEQKREFEKLRDSLAKEQGALRTQEMQLKRAKESLQASEERLAKTQQALEKETASLEYADKSAIARGDELRKLKEDLKAAEKKMVLLNTAYDNEKFKATQVAVLTAKNLVLEKRVQRLQEQLAKTGKEIRDDDDPSLQ